MQLQDRLPELTAQNAKVLAVTTDSLDTSRSVVKQLHLGYPIADDTTHALGTKFGVFSGSGHMGAVDQHAMVVLGSDGSVQWKQVSPQMNVPMDQVMAAVKGAS